jgi:hypothetical protein
MDECYPLHLPTGIGPRAKTEISIKKETIGMIFAIYRLIVHERKMAPSTTEF